MNNGDEDIKRDEARAYDPPNNNEQKVPANTQMTEPKLSEVLQKGMKTTKLAKDDPRSIGKLTLPVKLKLRGIVFEAISLEEVLNLECHRALLEIVNTRVMEVTEDAEEERIIEWIHFHGRSIAITPSKFVYDFLKLLNKLDDDLRVVCGVKYGVKQFDEAIFENMADFLTEECTTGATGIGVRKLK